MAQLTRLSVFALGLCFVARLAFAAESSVTIPADVLLNVPAGSSEALRAATDNLTKEHQATRLHPSACVRRWRVTLYLGHYPADMAGPMKSFQLGDNGPRVYYEGPSLVLPVPPVVLSDEYMFEVKYPPMREQLLAADVAEAAKALAKSSKSTSDAAYFRGLSDGAAITVGTK